MRNPFRHGRDSERRNAERRLRGNDERVSPQFYGESGRCDWPDPQGEPRGFGAEGVREPTSRYVEGVYTGESGRAGHYDERGSIRESRWSGGVGSGQPSRARHRGRGPRGYQRSDERILEEVCERLTDDPWINASSLEVSVDRGEVTLTGALCSRAQKRRARDLIEDVCGVRDVHSSVRVTSERTGALGGEQRAAPES